jgi:hypothetical protein
MAGTLYTFTRDQVRRLLDMLRRFEAWERSESGARAGRTPSDPRGVLLKVTGAVSSGLYPARLSYWDDAAGAERLSDEVRWKPRDGSAPATGDYVWGQFTGPTADGARGLYQGAKSPAGSGFTGTQVVVTDVSWNATTCVMAKTTKTVTFVNGIVTGIA